MQHFLPRWLLTCRAPDGKLYAPETDLPKVCQDNGDLLEAIDQAGLPVEYVHWLDVAAGTVTNETKRAAIAWLEDFIDAYDGTPHELRVELSEDDIPPFVLAYCDLIDVRRLIIERMV